MRRDNLPFRPLTPNSRSYLNRMSQPDTIVPGAGNSQAWDRYAYALNNPMMFSDPSGHKPCLKDEKCDDKIFTGYGRDSFSDHKGYSAWERNILWRLYKDGGPNAVHGVTYILQESIHFEVGTGWQSWGGTRGAWFNEWTKIITINSESPGNFSNGNLSLWALSSIIHEARHLEQGANLSHSKLGEFDAWQIGFDVYQNLGGKLVEWQIDILETESLDVFIATVKEYDPAYWETDGWGLITYPDMPDWCWIASGYTCPPPSPWWTNLNWPE